MQPAARIGSATNHPGVLQGPGILTVTIGALPAAVAQDPASTIHACSKPQTPPDPPSPIVAGSSTVTIGGFGAARVGDSAGCGATIVDGAFDVLIGD
jgi:uncharacterized Zn-binding protein involved in type VI secretion